LDDTGHMQLNDAIWENSAADLITLNIILSKYRLQVFFLWLNVTRIGRGKKPRAVEIHQVKALKEVNILTERLRGESIVVLL
jgi:hypothetical protein